MIDWQDVEDPQLNAERLYSLIETIPDAVFLKDGQGRWQIINSVAKQVFRLDGIDWFGKTDHELAIINSPLKEAHEYCIHSDQAAWDKEGPTRGEEFGYDLEGKLHYYDVTKIPLFYEDKTPKGLVIFGRDITSQKEAENEQFINHQIQQQLNKILKVSLQNVLLKEKLDLILNIVITSTFINLQKQGGIFVTDETTGNLVLTCHTNFHQVQQTTCNQVAFGSCLCGKAALTQKSIHVSHVDEMHEITYDGIKQHGHYAVPIVSNHKTIGVLIIYLEAGHLSSPKEIQFLESVSNILAGIIIRDRAEKKVYSSLHFLESLDRINNILLSTSSNEKMEGVNKELLEAMMDIYGADRSWLIYPCDPNAKNWVMAMKCNTERYPGIFEVGQEYPVTADDKIIYKNALACSDPIVFAAQPDTYEQYEVEKKISYKSCLSIIVKPKKGKPWLLGLDQCSYNRDWAIDEKKLLKQIATRFAESIGSYLLLEELRGSEAKYRSLTETARDIIVSYDLHGWFCYMNHIGLEFFGLNENNYKSRNVFDFIPDYEKTGLYKKFVTENERFFPSSLVEVVLENQNRESVPFEINSSPIELEDGKPGLISILRNVTERKQTNDKLFKQNAELQIINSELDKFVYSTSHDLRAPLTSIMGLINIVKEHHIVNKEMIEYVEMIDSSVQKLDDVIKNIIQYSKGNRLQLKYELIEIDQIYGELLNGLKLIKGGNDVKFMVTLCEGVPFMSDKIAIITILSNLLSNGVKYRRRKEVMAESPFVKFTFAANEKQAVITVQDNGEGIAEDKFQEIFSMFYRNSSASEGSGLGLYIVKQYINKLGGTIEVQSKLGEGSTFIVKLPNNMKL